MVFRCQNQSTQIHSKPVSLGSLDSSCTLTQLTIPACTNSKRTIFITGAAQVGGVQPRAGNWYPLVGETRMLIVRRIGRRFAARRALCWLVFRRNSQFDHTGGWERCVKNCACGSAAEKSYMNKVDNACMQHARKHHDNMKRKELRGAFTLECTLHVVLVVGGTSTTKGPRERQMHLWWFRRHLSRI